MKDFQFKSLPINLLLKVGISHTKWWSNYTLNRCASTAQKTNKHHYQACFSVSMGVFLYSSFLVYIQQSTAVMLCTAAHVHPCRVREKGKRGREGEWEGGRGENLAFTARDQRYIMGGRTILLHAVFLTNDYTTKQCAHILYKSKAARQALITVAPLEKLSKAERKYMNSRMCASIGYVYVPYNGKMFNSLKLQQFSG